MTSRELRPEFAASKGQRVGDTGYGAIALVLAIFARRKLARHAVSSPEAAGLIWVLLMGAA